MIGFSNSCIAIPSSFKIALCFTLRLDETGVWCILFWLLPALSFLYLPNISVGICVLNLDYVMFLCALFLSVYYVLCKLCSTASLHENAFLLRFSQIKLPETLPWIDVLCCWIAVCGYRQRNSAGCKRRSQPGSTSTTVQYMQWEIFREERVKSQSRGKLRNLFLMSKVCT